MSSEALAWAFRQDIKPSGLKFTLVAMCECANYRTGRIFASIAHLSEITGQDRKAIIANTAELEKRGFITDTGERTGRTNQVKVYSAGIGTVPETEPSQKRNSSVSSVKQYRKRDTEPSLEPSTPSIPNGIDAPPAGDAGEDDRSDDRDLLGDPIASPAAPPEIEPDHVVEAWNALADRLGKPRVRALTPERRQRLKARIAGYTIDDFREVFGNIEASAFLRGDEIRGKSFSGCNFDWATKKSNFQKILEGNYNG